MELKKETNEKFGTIRLTKDNDNPKLEGDMLYCVNDICKTLEVDLEWACDVMGRGFVFEYTFDNETLRFTMQYAVDNLFNRVCALSYNGKFKKTIDWVKEYVTWLYHIENDWVMGVTPIYEDTLLKNDDLSSAYEIVVNVYDINGCIIKTTCLDMFSNRDTANQFIYEYNKRVIGWTLEKTRPTVGMSIEEGVELYQRNLDGTTIRMMVEPHPVFNNWNAYTNINASFIRKCNLKF